MLRVLNYTFLVVTFFKAVFNQTHQKQKLNVSKSNPTEIECELNVNRT